VLAIRWSPLINRVTSVPFDQHVERKIAPTSLYKDDYSTPRSIITFTPLFVLGKHVAVWTFAHPINFQERTYKFMLVSALQ
jgi:hypothetical protein